MDRQNLVNVADFLKKKKKQELWNAFSKELKDQKPEIWDWLLVELEKKAAADKAAAAPTRSTSLTDNGGTPWKLNLFGN